MFSINFSLSPFFSFSFFFFRFQKHFLVFPKQKFTSQKSIESKGFRSRCFIIRGKKTKYSLFPQSKNFIKLFHIKNQWSKYWPIICGCQNEKSLTLRTFAVHKNTEFELKMLKCNGIAYRIVWFELVSVVWLHLHHVAIELPTIRSTMYPDTNPSVYMIQYFRCVCNFPCRIPNSLRLSREEHKTEMGRDGTNERMK